MTDTEIRVGTVTDKGAAARPELDREMYDAAVAFAKWCNEKGGILGRKLVVDDRDAKLFEYPQRIADSCSTDLALVGGGAVLDDDNEGARVACGLPNIPGYVVSPKARTASLQIQPLPSPVYKANIGPFKAAERLSAGGMQAFGVMTAPLPSTLVVRDALVESVGIAGGKVVYSAQYAVTCETNWDPFVQDMKSKGVKVLDFVGEPECFTSLQKQMDVTGFYPAVSILSGNFYEKKYSIEGGKTAKNSWVNTAFTPFEMAAENKATQDYLDLMKQYNPSGKVAILGEQAISAYLLFAKSASECGSNLTRACLMEKAKATTAWTGGGLHARTSPGTNGATPCFALLKVGDGTFTYDRAATAPTDGIFNCDPGNIVDLKNDYGVPR